tara:strand:- start:343 stop:555 length:213 start_codon:yes stop_codon:yes gene_type:complete
MIKNLLSNNFGRILVSCILGLALASLFKKVCVDDDCLIIKSDPNWNLDKKIFKENNKCFKFKPESTSCKV